MNTYKKVKAKVRRLRKVWPEQFKKDESQGKILDGRGNFGNLKNNKHFKRFYLRDLKKVDIEFKLLATAHNSVKTLLATGQGFGQVAVAYDGQQVGLQQRHQRQAHHYCHIDLQLHQVPKQTDHAGDYPCYHEQGTGRQHCPSQTDERCAGKVCYLVPSNLRRFVRNGGEYPPYGSRRYGI